MIALSTVSSTLRRCCALVGKAAVLACVLSTVAFADAQMRVTTIVAKRGALTERIEVVGSLAAREEIEVYPAVLGKEVRQILVEAGQHVERGQALAVLDTTEALMLLDKNAVSLLRAHAAVAVESSKIDVAMVTEAEARKKLDRSRSLQPKGAIADNVLEEDLNAHARAIAELRLARQSLELANADQQLIASERREIELTVQRSTLRAPSSGRILSRSARVGAMTSSSAGPLFVIADDDDIEFVAQVTETSFVRLREGMGAEITLPGRDAAIAGTVRLNAAQLDPKTRSGTVRIELADKARLFPGVFARGSISVEGRQNVLLPGTAVKSTVTGHNVYVVSDGLVDIRPVRIGSQQSGFVEIVDGIREGEEVVLKSGAFLKAQERVRPVLAATPEARADASTSTPNRLGARLQ
ncbi:efflux RND transporter periplasmic adaptor subunit [Neorhizobium galegae]|uniref:efflux RND transporter periplasmic adaptor subunit n=1 Tax=Neorhizobium galegae TaxID=399 RepID=UPI00210692A4|nr:efflux RND transporter periplasmic adaptor subunit [Neorhizobium galegae]MCQ1776363.1 efflux RND transporter periplasmic adaptor subunit [Neorhizobium galegae]MCQ1798619.1 efflux RND transporter periplasmic adaptor subunit [Neorhizobium galegae]